MTGRLESEMTRKAHELDTVELVCEVDGFPVGTRGTVVSAYPESALVEIPEIVASRSGLPARDLSDDLVSAPYSALRVVKPAAAAAR